jgi:hypothetical protein
MPEEIEHRAWRDERTMAHDLGGDRLRITKEQREEILRLYVGGEPRKAQLYAMRLGLREQYAYRLARERGAIPFTSSGHSHRERAVRSIPTPPRTGWRNSKGATAEHASAVAIGFEPNAAYHTDLAGDAGDYRVVEVFEEMNNKVT